MRYRVSKERSFMGGCEVFHYGKTVPMETVAVYGPLLMSLSATQFLLKLSLTVAFHFRRTSAPAW